MRTNHVTYRGIIVWYFLGKTWKFYARALETWVYFVVLIKSNCYSSLPYLRWACLYRASLRFLPSDSLGLNHQKVGLGPSAAALDTMIWWVMELWRTATARSREMGWRDRPEQFPEHLVVRQGSLMELTRSPKSSSIHFSWDIVWIIANSEWDQN